jgi:hypothetical protein
VLLFGCYSPEEEAKTEEKFSSKEQAIVVCSSDCAPPTYDGNPVACASNIYCSSDAAGAYCVNSNTTWSIVYCQTSAPPIYCGDGICNGSETWQTCSDCPPPSHSCGDGVCDYPDETRYDCSDCPGYCATCPEP